MDNQEKKAYFALAGVIAMPILVGAVAYAKTAREERAKRKKIQEWRQMNLDAIAASKDRMMRIVNDPTKNLGDLIKAWDEESKFMKLIADQPMY